LTAFLANQLNPITTIKKSSNLKVTPRPKDPPAVSPMVNSGLKSIENIKMYSPHSKFTKETIKMAQPIDSPIKIPGGYWEIRNPARRAIARKKIRRKCVRIQITKYIRPSHLVEVTKPW
jgi:hypothetical protein